MADINRDLDKYLRKRKEPSTNTFAVTFDAPSGGSHNSWWDKIVGSEDSDKPVEENLSPSEQAELDAMEADIRQEEARIEAVEEYEHELEDEQERKVSLYHQVLGIFRRRHREDLSDEDADDVELPVEDIGDPDVQEDFRQLAQIYLRWMNRLPKRVKDEFLESDDYDNMTEVLTRRGVAKRKY